MWGPVEGYGVLEASWGGDGEMWGPGRFMGGFLRGVEGPGRFIRGSWGSYRVLVGS